MLIRNLLTVLLLSLAMAAHSAEQEETYTDLVPGSGMLEPENLSNLVGRGDVRAMNNVGLLWAKGYEGKQSFEEAIRWWKEAAKRGYTVSMNNIGLAYANGHGVEVDMKQAFDWWFKAAMLGNAWAQNAVGDCYETGQGANQDFVQALTWYRTAAENGDAMAHYNVAALYESGRGVKQDYAEAADWYRQGARNGDAASMRALGRLYREGRGVEKDLVEAYAWHLVADLRFKPQEAGEAALNRQEAKRVATLLSPAQRKQADARLVQLETFTTPPKPDKPLAPNEKQI